jgi:hypothetical protein
MFDDAGLADRTRRVPEDDEGIDLKYLENALRTAEAKAEAEGNLDPVLLSMTAAT